MLRMSTLHRVGLAFAALWTLSSALPAGAASLTPDKNTIAVGETTYVKLESGSAFAVQWSASPQLQILASDSDGATIKGVSAGSATVNAKWLMGKKSTRITVTDAAGKPTMTGGRTGADISDPDMRRIGELLNRYKDTLGSLEAQFSRQDQATEDRKPRLSDGDQARLVGTAEAFFRELGGMGYGLKDLQRFRNNFMAAGPGGSPLFPGQGNWDRAFLGTERALMMGRALQVQQLWMETLHETFRDNPDAAVFGEIDIGSWVKMQLSGLGFPADIDFSSVAIDPELNRYLVDKFEGKLKQHTSLDMVQADALLTAHGQATPDVFIGHWGKSFAELDMLKRSKWKVLKPVFVNGALVRIDTVEKPGAQLFWEVAFRKLEAGRFAEADFPKMDLYKEPMLSLEMLRHGIHDIEHGPYTRGQQLIKMLKYAERSYFMNKKAVTEFWLDPYESNDPMLANVADKVIKNKNDPAVVADLLRGLAGEEITEANVDAVTGRLLERAKIAMHDNAARALAFRLDKIARIDREDTRQSELDGLWHDLETEIRTYQDTVGHPPEVMVRALELVKAVQEGKLPPSELEAKANELHRLLNEAYKLPNSVIDRIMVSDSYIKVRSMLRKLGWVEVQIDKFVETAKQKYPRGAQVADAVKQLNDQLNKTTAGSGLLKAADWADNAFTVYEAFMGGGNPNEAMWNASLAMGRIGLQEAFPSLAIPLSIYDGFRTGSPKPVAMAVAFYYFPFAGQTYMVSQQLQRVDVAMRDAEFYNSLGKMMAVTDFDTDGRIIRFHLMQATGKQELDSADIPPGNRQAVIDLFSRPDSTFYTSSNFRYWASLVPKQNDLFGLYENKLEKLRRFFAYSDDVRYATLMLENFKAQSDKLPQDKYTAERQAALERMEQQLQEAVWVAMADMLESSAKSVQSPALEAKIKKLEDDLDLGDDDLGAGKGLLSRVKWEIRQNSSLWTGENPYAVGVVYDKYIQAYERVKALRNEIILDIWHRQFDIDYSAAQGKPMKILLLGGRSGAPQLTGDIGPDVALAEKALAVHRQRAEKIVADLENALGRPVDTNRDRSHLAALGQFGLEWEHLLDDCPDRLGYQGSPEVQAALRERQDKYKAYLAKLAEGRARIFIEGDSQVEIGKPVSLTTRTENLDAATLKNLKYAWREEAMRGKLEAKGDSAAFSSPAPGSYKVWVELQQPGKPGIVKLAEAFHEIKVADTAPVKLGIRGPDSGEIDKTLAYTADINAPADVRNALRLEWRADGRLLGSGPGANFSSPQAGVHRIGLTAFQKAANGKEIQVASAEQTVTLAAKPKDDQPDKTDALPGGRDYTGATVTPPDKVDTYVATCSYQYGDWGACNRETKKQTRTVTGKTPAKCEERQKPVTEQGCTPPPTEEELKHRYLNCLCRCSSGWAGHIGVWYDPEGKTKPECESSGPCIGGIGAFGCSRRHFFGGSSDCAKGCWEGVWGKDSYDPDKADKLRKAENKKYKKPLTVKIKASKNPADFGDIVDLTAETAEGSGGYQWNWGGCAQDAKDASAKVMNSRDCKPCTASVTATDQDGDSASDSLLIQCTALKVKLSKERPAEDAIPVGGSATLFAQVFSGDKPAGGSFTYYWEPNPDVQYGTDPKNPAYETTGGSQSRNTAVFRKLGRTPVWVTVLKQVGETKMTMGESEQIMIDVISPKLTLKADKANPVVGEQVIVTVEESPKMGDDLIAFWWEYRGDTNNPGVHPNTPNSRAWSYKAKNDKPVTVTVHAKSKDNGDELDSASLTIAALKAQVSVTGPRIAGPAPMIWKEGIGLVALERQVAEHQRVEFAATVSPAVGDLRYQWRAEPSGCSIHSPSSRETGVTCSSTGSYALTVTVTNADGAELGSGSGSLSVSVSDRDVKQAPKSKEAHEKMQQAKQQASNGQLDQAIATAASAASLDPKNTEAKELGSRWSKERDTVQQQVNRANQALKANRPDDAQREIDAARKLHPKYPPVIDAEKQIADKRKSMGTTTGAQGTSTAATGPSQPVSLASVGGKQGTPRTVKGVSIDDSSWIRFKSTDENRRSLDIPVPTPTRAEAVAIVSNLDDATYLEQGKTIARITVVKDTGTETLDIQAGVHSSEWNYGVGPKHQRVNGADIGDNRFLVVLPLARPGTVRAIRIDYVETNAPKWAGHAPGFCLRGISLVGDTRGLTLTQAGSSAGGASPADAGAASGLAGEWSINANGYTGKVEFTEANGRTSGRVWYDAHRVWEPLESISFDGRTLRFLRPGPNQWYTGTLSGNEVRGSFTSGGTYSWSMTRTGAAIPGGRDYTSASSSSPGLMPDKTRYAPGETVTLRYSGIASPAAQDWIGLYSVNAKNEQYGEWFYLKANASGSLSFKAPNAPGSYEFRLFLNWPAGGYNDVARSQAIEVSSAAAPPPVQTGSTAPISGKGLLVLEDDAGPYKWIDSTEVQTSKVQAGRAAFKSNGNDHFTHRLGLVGNYPGQYRYLDFWLYLDKPEADIQIQVQADDDWTHRWGFEAGPKYNGYGWEMKGTTANLPSGRWLHQRLDLIGQLGIHAGQAITGMAFSSDGADVYYDSVYLLPSDQPLPPPDIRPGGKRVLEDDAGPYKWIDATVVQTDFVGYGRAAFRSNGNDHFEAELGIAGDYPEQFRYLTLWVLPIGPEADIQIQVRADGDWSHRWGFDAGPKYNGYGWEMKGTTTGLKPGVWQPLKLDLIGELGINPGQKITGIAFSSDGADVYYDSVYLLPNPNPAVKPSFQPTGKRVLEDDTGGYSWVDSTEVQDYLVFSGSRAFKSNGNDHFTADLGVAGNGAGQFRSIGFWAFFMGPEADLQLQVQTSGDWDHRWGFDAGPKYNGYGWAMKGSTTNMTSGRWTWIQVDLLDQLKLKPGDRITGLAFSSDGADVAYDSVYLLPSGASPGVGAGVPGGTAVQPGAGAGSVNQGNASLRLERDQFAPGESILVHFTAPGTWPDNAWIGIIPSSIPHGDERQNDNHDITYQYLKKRTSGTMTFTAPKAGDWDFRLHDTDSNGKEFASASFRVIMPGTATLKRGLKLVDRIPDASSASFRQNQRSDLVMHTSSWDRTPYFMTPPKEFELNFERIDRACLAGDAEGRTGLRIDNFLLLELFDPSGQAIGATTVGNHEGVSRNGQRLGQSGRGSHDFGACEVDLKGFLPVGRPFRLKATPMDYGGVGYASDFWLLLDGQGGATESPGGRDYTGQPTAPPSSTPTGQSSVSFDNGNIGGVSNGPTQPTTFTLNEPRILTLIQNYHWNSARGATPGTIALRGSDGRSYGPWQTAGTPGQGGVPNAYWTARPNEILPAGTYTVIDSSPATWSHNGQSGNRGFTRVETAPAGSTASGGRDYTAAPVQPGQLIFEVGNIGGVNNGPSRETKFSLSAPHTLTLIRNYHWNWGRGATPGTIALKGSDGRTYGPWPTAGQPGQGGVPNAYWTASPNLTLPAGTYTVIDSDPATWSHNGESTNRGFVRVEGHPAGTVPTAASGNGKVDDLGKQVDDLFDAVKSLKGLFGK
mgnify:CR=1 FL=1